MNIQSIIEFSYKLFTKDNITFALSLFGAAGTTYTLFSKRRKFSVSIHYYNYANRSLIMYASFTNHSHAPVSISNVSVVVDDVCYPCVYVPTEILQYTRKIGKEIVSQKEIMSIHLPISLLSLAGSSGYLYFDTLPDTYPDTATEVILEVSTSRGKAKRMRLSVPKN